MCTYSNTPDRLPLLAALFCLCPFALYACIVPCICLANDLLLLLQLIFLFCFSSKRHSWQMSAFKKSKKKPGSKSVQPYILYVWLSIVFSLIHHFNEFPLDDSNSIHEFIWHLLSLIEHISLFSSYSGSELNFYFRCLYKCFENRNSSLLPLYCPHTLSIWITALLLECSLLSLSHQSEKNRTWFILALCIIYGKNKT